MLVFSVEVEHGVRHSGAEFRLEECWLGPEARRRSLDAVANVRCHLDPPKAWRTGSHETRPATLQMNSLLICPLCTATALFASESKGEKEPETHIPD